MMTNHDGSNLRNATQLFASLKLKKFFSSDIEIVRLKEKKADSVFNNFFVRPNNGRIFGPTDIWPNRHFSSKDN